MSPMSRRMTPLICTLAIPFALSGCGSSRKSASICRAGAQQLVAHTLGLSPNRVAAAASKGNNGMPQCSFRAPPTGGGRLEVTVNVDTSPQPYMVLARTIEERSQGFTPTTVLSAPVAVMGLGLEASWFPDESALMSTDGVRLVTVTLRGSRAKQAAKIRFATRISRLYLGRSKPSLAKRSP
jgi:hypothetical protein